LFNGKDFTATIKVEEFDALIRPLLPKFIAPLQAVLAQAKAQSIDISSISGTSIHITFAVAALPLSGLPYCDHYRY